MLRSLKGQFDQRTFSDLRLKYKERCERDEIGSDRAPLDELVVVGDEGFEILRALKRHYPKPTLECASDTEAGYREAQELLGRNRRALQGWMTRPHHRHRSILEDLHADEVAVWFGTLGVTEHQIVAPGA